MSLGNKTMDKNGSKLPRQRLLVFLLLAYSMVTLRWAMPNLIILVKDFDLETQGDSAEVILPYFFPKKNNRTNSLPFHFPRNHPRVGARDENGSYGLIVDPYLVRRSMIQKFQNSRNIDRRSFLPLTLHEYDEICNKSVGEGHGEQSMNAVKLLRPVRAVYSVPLASPSILCVVYTHGGVLARVSAIVETWGWRCDGFFASSTITVRDPSQSGFGSIDLVHSGEEEYGNMWQKTRSILAYLYEHYLDEFQYYYICGDDTFVIPENLKAYLAGLETQFGPGDGEQPLLIGRERGHNKSRYVGGGGGYMLNREALRLYNEESGLMDGCSSESRVAAEDRFISRCFQRENVWPLQPFQKSSGKLLVQRSSPAWMIIDIRRALKTRPIIPYTIIPEDSIANETYAWHMIHRDSATHTLAMKRYHAHFYESCPLDSKRAQSIQSYEFSTEPVVVLAK